MQHASRMLRLRGEGAKGNRNGKGGLGVLQEADGRGTDGDGGRRPLQEVELACSRWPAVADAEAELASSTTSQEGEAGGRRRHKKDLFWKSIRWNCWRLALFSSHNNLRIDKLHILENEKYQTIGDAQ